MGKCGSKNCNLTNREKVQETQRLIVDPGYEISKSKYYNSPRISSEIPDCSLPLTADHLSSCSYNCTFCVPSGTKILMFNGREKSIQEIKKGEEIISINTTTMEYEVSEVIATMKRKPVKELVVLYVEDKKLQLTWEHPIFIKDKGWVIAKEVCEGDEALLW